MVLGIKKNRRGEFQFRSSSLHSVKKCINTDLPPSYGLNNKSVYCICRYVKFIFLIEPPPLSRLIFSLALITVVYHFSSDGEFYRARLHNNLNWTTSLFLHVWWVKEQYAIKVMEGKIYKTEYTYPDRQSDKGICDTCITAKCYH